MRIEGLKRLQLKLKALKEEARRQTLKSVIVGYTASYALAVHENVEMKGKGKPRRKRGKKGKNRGKYWDPQGLAQAKFLEAPAREMADELGGVCAEITKATGDIQKGLLAAGLRLQRESQKRVPVDTGNLKNSAFTRLE